MQLWVIFLDRHVAEIRATDPSGQTRECRGRGFGSSLPVAERFPLFGGGGATTFWLHLKPEFNSYPNKRANHMSFGIDVFPFQIDRILHWAISIASEKTVVIVSIWMRASEIRSVVVRALPIRRCEIHFPFLVSKHIIYVSLSIRRHSKSPLEFFRSSGNRLLYLFPLRNARLSPFLTIVRRQKNEQRN